jgi:alcohol dehydrogenase, propanol-preferring
MASMTAYRMVDWQRAEFDELPVPTPGPGEVRVEVAGVGLCHSDILFLDAEPGRFPYELPYTLGHEIAGWVDELGTGVAGLAPGDAVVACSHLACGLCTFCRRGHDNYCTLSAAGLGFGRDGGLANYVIVDRRALVGPTTLDPRHAGPLADAGYTSYHAVRRVLPKLVPGSTALVIGTGGLGSYAIQFIKQLSAAKVVAVDVAAHRLEVAASCGADVTIAADDAVAERVREAVGSDGAEGVFDFVGADATMALALSNAATMGTAALVGAAGGTAQVSWQTVRREVDVFIPQGGTMSDLAEVVALAEQGRLRFFDETFSFGDVPDAYRRLRSGDLRGRAVVLPNG